MTKHHPTNNSKHLTPETGRSPNLPPVLTVGGDRFHDIDEVLSSPTASTAQPGWVLTREINNPTCEISWEAIQRFDGRESLHTIHSIAKYVGGVFNVYDAIKKGNDKLLADIKHSPRGMYYQALIEGCRITPYFGKTFLGREHAERSAIYREPVRWQGTPEENLRLITAAAKYYGAQDIGSAELNDIERKLLFTFPRGNNRPPASYGKSKASTNDFTHNWPPPDDIIKPIVFEDVPCGYEGRNKYVIPLKPLWIISIMMPTIRLAPNDELLAVSNYDANIYRTHTAVQTCLQDFLRALGYQGMGYPDDSQGLLPAASGAVLSGLAEMSRNNNYCISPSHGTMVRFFSMITDLPLAPTHPIDAGLFSHCHTCHECANICPVSAISLDSEPSWEPPNIGQIPNKYTSSGKKLFFDKTHICKKFSLEQSHDCGICMVHCPFNSALSKCLGVFSISAGSSPTSPIV